MKASSLLHCAFRSPDPVRLGKFYAEIFECGFYIHPVLSGLGIVMLKLTNPEAVYRGLLEFWPADLHWNGEEARFERKPAAFTPVQNHIAVRVDQSREEIFTHLEGRVKDVRCEARGPGFQIVCFDDPDGNFVEVFPNLDTVPLPPEAYCSVDELDGVMAELGRYVEAEAVKDETNGTTIYPLVYHPLARSLALPRKKISKSGE
jgi:hypothetical protein